MLNKKSLNKGRNVINLEQLKEDITLYTKEKKRSLAVTSWLKKNLFRWVVNHFSYVQVVQSRERYQVLIGKSVPKWFQPEREEIDFIFIDSKHLKFQELLEKCAEYLSSKEPKMAHKFHKMTVEQVLEKWEEEHQRFIRKECRYRETSGDGVESVFVFENLHIVKLKHKHKELPLEMAKESALMQHCLGEFDNNETGEGGYGEYYKKRIQKSQLELFSLRDEKNMPHATLAVYRKKGIYWLDQIKGKQNKPPIARYVSACVAFFNFLDLHYDYNSDTLGMGVVYVDGKSLELKEIKDEKIQQYLVAYRSDFILQLPNPSKATLWLATLREAPLLSQLEMSNDAMKISALLQDYLLMLKIKFSLNITPKELLKGAKKFQIEERIFKFIKIQIKRV